MKNIFLALVCILVAGAASAQNTYTINGKISGKADGMKVYLQSMEWPAPEIPAVSDSTVIRNGQFTFKGHVDVPVMSQIIIDRTPKGEDPSQRNWVAGRFYLENSNIKYSGDIKTLPTYYWKKNSTVKQPVITGSAAQDESVKYNAAKTDLSKELGKINEEYLKVYHLPALDGIFNTKEGIALANKEDSLNEKNHELTMKYIAQHPSSVIAYDQAMIMVSGMFVTITEKQIDDLTDIIRKGWAGTPSLTKFEKAAENAKKTAIGTKYQDFEFITPDGKKVMLSQDVPKGKIVMLEFWASWCGPCRGEIPHLKHLNEEKSDVFSIVSISLDDNDAEWQKAMKDEGMEWTQLADPHGFEGEIAKAYNILGIPHSIILDKEGRILKVGLRGAYLDAYLEKLEEK